MKTLVKIFKKKVPLLIVASVLLTVQGCSTTKGTGSLANLVIAEPLTVNYKSEIALARLTEVIQRAEISDTQKAQLYYDRGVIYDSVGLRNLARLDFNRALRLKPDLVDAYNFLGIHFTLLKEFNQAYDAFDSAIELSPTHEYAFLNRGIALYYGGRPQLAADDLQVFHQNQVNDPYRILWLYIAEQQVDATTALENLAQRAQFVDDKLWAMQIIDLFLGKITQNQFIDGLTANVSHSKELTDRLCEAYFYLGKFAQMNNQDRVSLNFFKLALSTNVFEFVEHRYAKLELELMRQTEAY